MKKKKETRDSHSSYFRKWKSSCDFHRFDMCSTMLKPSAAVALYNSPIVASTLKRLPSSHFPRAVVTPLIISTSPIVFSDSLPRLPFMSFLPLIPLVHFHLQCICPVPQGAATLQTPVAATASSCSIWAPPLGTRLMYIRPT